MDHTWDDGLFDVAALLRDIEADTDRLMQMAEEETVADLLAQLEKDEQWLAINTHGPNSSADL